jgi:hypothetical protein
MDAGALGFGSPAQALSNMAVLAIRAMIKHMIGMSIRNIFVLFSASSRWPGIVLNYIEKIGYLSIFVINN